jgi:hypothetical protein
MYLVLTFLKQIFRVTSPRPPALKELPGDPAALKRAAQDKRKQKEAEKEEIGTNVRQMMTGVLGTLAVAFSVAVAVAVAFVAVVVVVSDHPFFPPELPVHRP